MSTVPIPLSPLVTEAIEWLRATDTAPVSRQTAENLLPHWPNHANLTDVERRLVLDHFGQEPAELPGCGQPATSWIGMYAPGQNTVYGDLKASLYVCEAHAVDGVEVAHKLDLTPHCFPDDSASRLPTPCGLFYDFRAVAESGTRVPDYSSKPDATDSDDPQVRQVLTDLGDAESVARIDAKLRGHAWTVRRLPDHGMDDFLWVCRCGHEIVQAQGFPGVVDRLIAHCAQASTGVTTVEDSASEQAPGKAERRLDAWSRGQHAALDDLEPEA